MRFSIQSQIETLSHECQEYFCRDLNEMSIYFDDLGAETPVNEYGIRIETVADFICEWHTLHTPGTRMIITTNLNTEGIDSRYGGRVLSRLKDLCIPLRLTGKDKRKWQM